MDEKITFNGTVTRCVYSSEDYKTYAVDIDRIKHPDIHLSKYGTCTIVGNIPELNMGTEYSITAVEKNDKYGYSYKVLNIRRDKPLSEHDVLVFLHEFLTDNQANQLYLNYPNCIELIINGEDDKIDLNRLKGIKEKTFEKIKSTIIENYVLSDLVVEYHGVFTLSMLKKLYSKYTSLTALQSAIKKEPYKCLCGISGVGFMTADKMLLELEKKGKLSLKEPLVSSSQRCLAYMLYLLQEDEQGEKGGNTYIDMLLLKKKIETTVPKCSHHFVECLKSDYIYYNKSTLTVSIAQTFYKEAYIATRMIEGIHTTTDWDFDWTKYQNQGKFPLSDEQMELLKGVCHHNVFILEGSAGSGKSASTEMLIKMLDDNFKICKLSAPTGKASKVLSEYTHKEAKTIHRTYLYNPKTGWGYNQDNLLDCDLFLIDEFSMVDISLMVTILKAIDFTKTKLVFVGDSNQLPSISCGNLMHDFLTSNIIPKATLTKIFRYGKGGVLTVATDIRMGKKFLPSTKKKVNAFGENKDYVFINTPDEEIISDCLGIYKLLLTKGYNGKTYTPDKIAVLTSYRVGEYGVEKLNKELQKIANTHYGTSNSFKSGEHIYYLDDIVMQQSNNYHAKCIDDDYVDSINFGSFGFKQEHKEMLIANGETGHIVDITPKEMLIEFDTGTVKYEPKDVNTVDLGYSYTIHKSQGSGIEIVILLTPKAHTYTLNSNLLYVGITRTIDACFHLGNLRTVNNAISKKANFNRNTYMQSMLKKLEQNYNEVEKDNASSY